MKLKASKYINTTRVKSKNKEIKPEALTWQRAGELHFTWSAAAISKVACRCLIELVNVIISTILNLNHVAPTTAVVTPVITDLAMDDPFISTWMGSIHPSREIGATTLSRDTSCMHLLTRKTDETVPSLCECVVTWARDYVRPRTVGTMIIQKAMTAIATWNYESVILLLWFRTIACFYLASFLILCIDTYIDQLTSCSENKQGVLITRLNGGLVFDCLAAPLIGWYPKDSLIIGDKGPCPKFRKWLLKGDLHREMMVVAVIRIHTW